jgi:hypothetical protein
MLRGDDANAYLALVGLHRDPKRWFASATEGGIPRLWARGDSEHDVRTKLELAVADRSYDKSRCRVLGDWDIVVHPPDGNGEDADTWIDWPVDGAAA